MGKKVLVAFYPYAIENILGFMIPNQAYSEDHPMVWACRKKA
jgi:hypothetical protein